MPQTTQPPAGQSLLIQGSDQTAMSWVSWFQSVSDRLDACEARLLVSEARLLNLEGQGALIVAAGSYANDAAAAAAGVLIGGYYRAGSQLMVRVV